MPPDKQEQVWSQLQGYERDGSIVITVTDTGAGMSDDELIHTFEEGVQFNAGKLQAGGGSGLGLFITKGLVEQHGGRIWVSSEGQGRGSMFAVELPTYLPLKLDSWSDAVVSGATADHPSYKASATAAAHEAGSTNRLETAPMVLQRSSDAGRSWPEAPQPSPQDSLVTQTMSTHDDDKEPAAASFAAVDSTSQSTTSSPRSSRSNMSNSNCPSAYAINYPNILIVDDAISNRKLLHRLLTAKGFTCHQAVDGLDALRVYEEVTRQHREQLHGSQGAKTSGLAMPEVAIGGGTSICDIDAAITSVVSTTELYVSTIATATTTASDPMSLTSSSSFPSPSSSSSRECDEGSSEFFSTILMDFEMPEMDGPTATRELRTKLGCTCLIFGVTGNMLPQDVDHFKQQGANKVLAKPLTLATLEHAWEQITTLT